jgi:antitoxin ParD1/3/4
VAGPSPAKTLINLSLRYYLTTGPSLTPELDAFIDPTIESGEYQNASETVRDAVRALQQRRREDVLKLEALRRQIDTSADAVARGDFTEIADVDPGKQGKGVVAAGVAVERHVDPQHREGLQQARGAQSAGIHRVKPEIGDEARHHGLVPRVVAGGAKDASCSAPDRSKPTDSSRPAAPMRSGLVTSITIGRRDRPRPPARPGDRGHLSDRMTARAQPLPSAPPTLPAPIMAICISGSYSRRLTRA